MVSLALLDFDRVVRSRRRRLIHCHGAALVGMSKASASERPMGLQPAQLTSATPTLPTMPSPGDGLVGPIQEKKPKSSRDHDMRAAQARGRDENRCVSNARRRHSGRRALTGALSKHVHATPASGVLLPLATRVGRCSSRECADANSALRTKLAAA